MVDPFQLETVLKDVQQSAIATLPSAEKSLDSLRQWAVTEKARSAAAFDPRLRAFCKTQSYRLDGGYPSYIIEGFLTVRAHDTKREIKVGSSSFRTMMLDTIAPAIREQVADERARKFDASEFIERLFQAYERCLLLERSSIGSPIPVRKVYQELVLILQPEGFLRSASKALFKEYSVELFARDLAKLMESGNCRTSGGKWLSDRPTSFAADGIPILQNGQVRIVGKIVFSGEQA